MRRTQRDHAARAGPPAIDERVLDRVLGEVDIAEDPKGDCIDGEVTERASTSNASWSRSARAGRGRLA